MSQFPEVRIVEASAGSGKTYCLSKRYVQLLLNSASFGSNQIQLKNILAITFSNKASHEMKERIIEFLKKIALDKFSSQKEKADILSSLGIDEASAKKKAYTAMECIIKNYNFFQVNTIDSFINTMLSGCAFRLNLSANFRIKRDYSEQLSYSLDKLIDRALIDEPVFLAFKNFLIQYLYIENKSSWFPKRDILSLVMKLFFSINKYGGNFLLNDMGAEELLAMKKDILERMRYLLDNLPAGTHKGFQKSFTEFMKNNKEAFDVAKVSDYFAREEFPVVKGTQASPDIEKTWLKIKEALRELCLLESRAVFNPYVNIFSKVISYFKALSGKDDVLFLEELNWQARALFAENAITVPELYYRLAVRLKHFLIDEFQDTSSLQWRNLYLMIEEALSSGGSLFCVGDKKQAIYRFRGGDTALFDSVKEDLRSFNVRVENLSSNYRSRKQIVLFVNKIFSKDNLNRFLSDSGSEDKCLNVDEIQSLLKIFEGSQQSCEKQDSGYVKVEFLNYEDKEDRYEKVRLSLFSVIEDFKKRNFAYSDIAILARKNEDVELVTGWLIEKGIPVESEKTLNIRNNPYIKELISLLKFLNSPIDNLSFASFILGDIFSRGCGINKDELHDFVFAFKQKTSREKNIYLYREFRRLYPDIWDNFLKDFFKNIGFVPLYELIISIFNKFRCLDNFKDYQGFFMKLLELVKLQEEDRQGISLFLEFFDKTAQEDLHVRASMVDAVKVLTIHKSKGLGFSAVILPFLELNTKVDTTITFAEDNFLVLSRINKKYRKFSPEIDVLYRQEYLKSFADELNNIYVAMTRAKDELCIFVPRKSANTDSDEADSVVEQGQKIECAGLFDIKDNFELGVKMEFEKKNEVEKDVFVDELPVSRYEDWLGFLKDEFSGLGGFERREKVLRGEVLHCILSSLGNLALKDKDEILKKALDEASVRFARVKDFKDYEAVIKKLLSEEKLKQFFLVSDAQVFQEKEVVDAFGNLKRIDRLVVGEKEVWIIDYKSTKDTTGKNLEQVKEYISIISKIYSDKKVKGFLIYLDSLELEEVLNY